jgi:hypothetical protein
MGCCAWFFYDKIEDSESDDVENTSAVSVSNATKTNQKKEKKACRKKRNVLKVPMHYIKGIASKIKRKNIR